MQNKLTSAQEAELKAKWLDEEIAKNKLISIPYPKKASARTPYGAVTYELD